jgi:ABC-2 type transport system permease protein
MTDIIASEFLKIRTVRSSYALLATVGAMMALGVVMVIGMTVDFDSSSVEEQAHFAGADASVIVIPFTQFCLAAFGALAVTSEFGTGMIRPSLVAVPRRRAIVAGKVVVVGGLTLAVGQLVAFGSYLVSSLIAGGHPAPLWPWKSTSDAMVAVLSNGLSIMVIGLVGLGVGLIVRSTAGALITIVALLLVLPVVAFFVPKPWDERVASVMLPNLAPQVSGTAGVGLLSPTGALVVMVTYVVVALGAGALALSRRDP